LMSSADPCTATCELLVAGRQAALARMTDKM